jgi:hypothetical protein
MTDRRKYGHEDDDVSRMAGDSGRVVAERRQSRGGAVEVVAAQTEEAAPTQAVRPAKPQVRPVLPKFSIAPTRNGRP